MKKAWALSSHKVHSEDSDLTGRMPMLIRVFTVRTGHFVGFVMRGLILSVQTGKVLTSLRKCASSSESSLFACNDTYFLIHGLAHFSVNSNLSG